jgi:hypothetical protein
MTCIVGLVDDSGVYLGADSVGADVSQYLTRTRKDSKVFYKRSEGSEVDNFLIGFTTSFRMGQLVQHSFIIPEPPVEQDKIFGYLCTKFVDALRKTLSDGGYMSVENKREEGGEFLVGFSGRLFCVGSDFQVAEHTEGYDAIGCGYAYALGSFFTTSGQDTKSARVLMALEAAAKFSAYVQGPFNILKLEGERK